MTSVVALAIGLGAFGCTPAARRSLVASSRCQSLYAATSPVPATRLPAFADRWVRSADFSSSQVKAGSLLLRASIPACVAVASVNMVAGILVLGVTAGLPTFAVFALRDRRDQRLRAALPEALELVARSLRSGSSVVQALDDASVLVPGPLGRAFQRIVAGTQRGEPLTAALHRFALHSPLSEIRVAVAALALAAESGAGPSRALDGVSASLRDGQRLHAELGALTSQARMSALVLIALPVVFVAVNAAIDPSALAFLLNDGLGRICLGIGLGLDVVGWVWMSGLVRRVQA